jgi:hypothetical protein
MNMIHSKPWIGAKKTWSFLCLALYSALFSAISTVSGCMGQPSQRGIQSTTTTTTISTVSTGLRNPPLVNYPDLVDIVNGKADPIKPGDSRESIKAIKNAFETLWYNLPLGSIGISFDEELSVELEQFQKNERILTKSGQFDRETLLALDNQHPTILRSKYFRFHRFRNRHTIFVTIAVGYCPWLTEECRSVEHESGKRETNADHPGLGDEIKQVRKYLKSHGYEAQSKNRERICDFFSKAGHPIPRYPEYGSKAPCPRFEKQEIYLKQIGNVEVLLRIVLAFGLNAKRAFLESLREDDITVYTGHGRWGTGPDFDGKSLFAGNLFINPDSTVDVSDDEEAEDYIHRVKKYTEAAKRDAKKARIVNVSYPNDAIHDHVWFFDGCNTDQYLIPLRRKGISALYTDLLGWGKIIGISKKDENISLLLSYIEQMQTRSGVRWFLEELNSANGAPAANGLHVEGLGDNPEGSL